MKWIESPPTKKYMYVMYNKSKQHIFFTNMFLFPRFQFSYITFVLIFSIAYFNTVASNIFIEHKPYLLGIFMFHFQKRVKIT